MSDLKSSESLDRLVFLTFEPLIFQGIGELITLLKSRGFRGDDNMAPIAVSIVKALVTHAGAVAHTMPGIDADEFAEALLEIAFDEGRAREPNSDLLP